jgi:predicted lipid-binding transport protein (Tim44 family)
MKRFLLAFAVMAATLVLISGDADARAGFGGSFGSRGLNTFSAPPATRTAPSVAPIQRSITQPSQPALGAPVTSPGFGGGFFGRPGFFGGMMTGFLGAGLLGLMFGHGLFGGLGGISSILGLLIQVALVVIVARLAWAWWQRRNAPVFAGIPRNIASDPSYRANLGGAAGGGAAPQSPVTIAKEDFDAFERLLVEIQTAYSDEDLAALRARLTPEMLSYFAEELAANTSRGVVNRVSDVKLVQGDLAEAWREGAIDYATVAMRFSLVDKTIDRATGRAVEGSDAAQQVTEVWTFMRSRGGSWLLSAIQQA